jgi:hypothetical protein
VSIWAGLSGSKGKVAEDRKVLNALESVVEVDNVEGVSDVPAIQEVDREVEHVRKEKEAEVAEQKPHEDNETHQMRALVAVPLESVSSEVAPTPCRSTVYVFDLEADEELTPKATAPTVHHGRQGGTPKLTPKATAPKAVWWSCTVEGCDFACLKNDKWRSQKKYVHKQVHLKAPQRFADGGDARRSSVPGCRRRQWVQEGAAASGPLARAFAKVRRQDTDTGATWIGEDVDIQLDESDEPMSPGY